MAAQKPAKDRGVFVRVADWIHSALAAEANQERRTIGAQLKVILEERYREKKSA